MKVLQYIRFAGKDIGRRKLAFLLNLLFCAVAVYLMYNVVHMSNMAQCQRKLIEKMLQPDSEEFYQVCILDMNIEDETFGARLNQLIRDISTLDNVAGFGIHYDTNEILEELCGDERLTDILEKHSFMGYVGNYPYIMYAEADMLQACGAKLCQGSYADYEAEGDAIPVLAGYDYREILSVGDTLTARGSGQIYRVVGILEQDSRFFYKNDIVGGMDAYTSLDAYLVIPALAYGMEENSLGASQYMNTICFYVEDKQAAESACSEILQLAEKDQMGIEIKSLEQLFDENEQSEAEEIRMTIILAYTVVVLALVALTVTGIVQILTHKREYAIMLSCGFSYGTLCRLVFLENLIKAAIAFWAGCLLSQRELCFGFWVTAQDVEAFWSYDTWMVAGILVTFVVLATLIPARLLSRIRISHLV